jgi:chemotaxis-related protein WspB
MSGPSGPGRGRSAVHPDARSEDECHRRENPTTRDAARGAHLARTRPFSPVALPATRREGPDGLLMLVVELFAGDGRYAVPVRRIVEVLPRLELRELPLAPPEVAGLFNYRGRVIPVLDLCAILTRTPCPPRLANRILVVSIASGSSLPGAGLLVEKISTEVLAAGPSQPGAALPGAAFLDGVLVSGREIVPVVEPERLVTPELWSILRPAIDAAKEEVSR